ncbi:EamA family transporter [Kribbella kalugense]|uniref:EamA-like transporter family protein n=1 Tax=Kribbella kalugense TaxID=2512221 RepID=A0A4R8A2I3_9ACTN|nr:EamA family transporter [Kribbella kalugense]TDW23831.1 EamA-like transporter family protein [Kribbella kalugense]
MIALGLLTASAGCHAAWNLLLKRGGLGGPAFVWLCGLLTLPISVVLLVRGSLTTVWWAGLVSMLLHTTYAVTLQKAYSFGEFSTVYSVSRGTAPALVAVATMGTRVFAGAALVLVGVLLMERPHSRRPARGVVLGLAVATCTAAYTLWDGFAVSSLHVDLLTYLAVANVAQVVVLSAVVSDRRKALQNWRQALPIAVLMPASYGLVLVALSVASVGTVAIGRSLNVVVGVLLGVVVLHERLNRSRVIGLATMVGGVLLVSV